MCLALSTTSRTAMNDLWIDRFADYLRASLHYSEQTVVVYMRALEVFSSFISPNDDAIDWALVSKGDVREWVVAQMEQHLEPATISKRLSAVRSFFRFLMMREVAKTDPARTVSAPKKEKKLPSFISEKEMDRLFDHITFASDYNGRRDRLVLLILYSTGIRLSELVGLDLNSIDFHSSTLKVLGKRNKERIVPFGAELSDALNEYLPLRAQQPMTEHSPALFPGKKVPRINKTDVSNIVRQYLGQVTTQRRRSPHVLRHSFATAMLNNGAEIEVVRQLLGHESVATTEIYTHTTFEELKKVYRSAHPRSED